MSSVHRPVIDTLALTEWAHWCSVGAGKPKSPRSAATRVGVCDLGAGARGNRASLGPECGNDTRRVGPTWLVIQERVFSMIAT